MMAQDERRDRFARSRPRRLWTWAGIVLGPPAVFTVYLTLSRWPSKVSTGDRDWAALVLSILAGVICIARLKIPATLRVVLAVIYCPIAGWLLIYWAFFFVCAVFGDCL